MAGLLWDLVKMAAGLRLRALCPILERLEVAIVKSERVVGRMQRRNHLMRMRVSGPVRKHRGS